MELSNELKLKLFRKKQFDIFEQVEQFNIFYEKNYIIKLTRTFTKHDNLVENNTLIFIQTHLSRMKLLLDGYIHLINNNNPLSSSIILRSIFETTGSIALLHKKYIQYISNDITKEDFSLVISRLYLGIKIELEMDKSFKEKIPEPYNVMTLIDSLDFFMKKKFGEKKVRFRRGYDNLSEVSHPNFFGYMAGHKITTNAKSINFINSEEVEYEIRDYKLEYFNLIVAIYMMIYDEIRIDIERNGILCFEEFTTSNDNE